MNHNHWLYFLSVLAIGTTDRKALTNNRYDKKVPSTIKSSKMANHTMIAKCNLLSQTTTLKSKKNACETIFLPNPPVWCTLAGRGSDLILLTGLVSECALTGRAVNTPYRKTWWLTQCQCVITEFKLFPMDSYQVVRGFHFWMFYFTLISVPYAILKVSMKIMSKIYPCPESLARRTLTSFSERES